MTLLSSFRECNRGTSFAEYYDEAADDYKIGCDTVEVIFFAVLGYPFKFGYCTLDDFKDAYLNGRTLVKVELEHEGVFFELNRCIPLLRTTITELKQKYGSNSKFDCWDVGFSLQHYILLYFDYLLYTMEEEYRIRKTRTEIWDDANERERNIFNSFRRRCGNELEACKDNDYKSYRVIRNRYAKHND